MRLLRWNAVSGFGNFLPPPGFRSNPSKKKSEEGAATPIFATAGGRQLGILSALAPSNCCLLVGSPNVLETREGRLKDEVAKRLESERRPLCLFGAMAVLGLLFGPL